MSIKWLATYKIGQADIDRQHEHLFELTNALMAADSLPDLRKLIMELYKYTREHFEFEETLMRKLGFVDLASHAEAHNQLLSRLNKVSQQVGQGQLSKSAIEELMTDWILKHVLNEDARLAAVIAAQAG
ncbi:bacteriohemerythrin [mine drainage metagenome]|uniref:Bacteriohemerythrin n=1 Tax=mine drainage metagenome TaxID=410659 RepID=A0A1J5PNW5_9ZZZZ